MIDKSQPSSLFIFSSPRGGTNLFCALMHNHPEIVALTHSATKQYLLSPSGNKRSLPDFSCENLIYRKGGFYKDYTKTSYVVFDKVHYSRQSKWCLWNNAISVINNGKGLGLNVIRHPFAVLASMDSYHKKHFRLRWKFTTENIAEFYEYYFRKQVMLLQNNKVFPIVFEKLISNLPDEYRKICAFLNLDYSETYTDFRKTFNSIGAPGGGKISVKTISDYSGSHLEKSGFEATPEPMFYDDNTKEHTLGRGGFNPCQPINKERILESLEEKSQEQVEMFSKVFRKGMSDADVDYLLNTNFLCIDRLKKMDIASLNKYYKKVSFLPKISRNLKNRLNKMLG